MSAAAIAKTIADRLVRRGPEPDKVRRVEIRRITVEFEEGEIRRVIEELIENSPPTMPKLVLQLSHGQHSGQFMDEFEIA